MEVKLLYWCPVCVSVFEDRKSIFARHIRSCCPTCGNVAVDVRTNNDIACRDAAQAQSAEVEEWSDEEAAKVAERESQRKTSIEYAREARRAQKEKRDVAII